MNIQIDTDWLFHRRGGSPSLPDGTEFACLAVTHTIDLQNQSDKAEKYTIGNTSFSIEVQIVFLQPYTKRLILHLDMSQIKMRYLRSVYRFMVPTFSINWLIISPSLLNKRVLGMIDFLSLDERT